MQPRSIDVTLGSRITAVVGMSRSGKSAYVKRQVRTRRRLLVWDPDGEFVEAGICQPLTARQQLLDVVSRQAGGRYSYIAPVRRDEFNFWSLAVLHWRNCAAVAEETSDVTSPGKAPEQWGQLIRKGNKRGIELYAVTQAPSESDKTVMRQARFVVCFLLGRDVDRAYMAAELDLPKERLQQLRTVEREFAEGLVVDKHCFNGSRVKPLRLNFKK